MCDAALGLWHHGVGTALLDPHPQADRWVALGRETGRYQAWIGMDVPFDASVDVTDAWWLSIESGATALK